MLPLFGREQPVVARCLRFLRQSQRGEGAWPIDTNLSVWLTTAAVTALASAGELPRIDRDADRPLDRRARNTRCGIPIRTPSRAAGPGPICAGGVPDVDDTSGAILALQALGERPTGVGRRRAVAAWHCRMATAAGPRSAAAGENCPSTAARPTSPPMPCGASLCRGHAVRGRRPRLVAAGPSAAACSYLCRSQQADGSWIPLWFGNQAAPGQTNPVLGTSRVLRALEATGSAMAPRPPRRGSICFASQNADGGWGGAPRSCAPRRWKKPPWPWRPWLPGRRRPRSQGACFAACEYLVERVGRLGDRPAPIGLYFAHLWYSEQLYPLIWTLDALGRAAKCVICPRRPQPSGGHGPFDASRRGMRY